MYPLRDTTTFSNTKVISILCIIFLARLLALSWLNDVGGRREWPMSAAIAPLMDFHPKDGLVRTFVENSVHYRLDGDDEEWEALYPNGGIVYVGENKKPFTISMFHQLRCLDILRHEIVRLEAASNDPDPSETEDKASNSTSASNSSPLHYHCVDYLRQMVLCRADLELDPVFGKPHPAVIPDVYQCRDWNKVYTSVKEKRGEF